MKGIYLDYAATTPVDPDVLHVMHPYHITHFANPSSIHAPGVANRKVINEARKTIASCLHVKQNEIYFTSGGTESINWAIKGYAFAHPEKKEIIISQIEHHATIHTCQFLEKMGYKIHYIPVDKKGFLNIKKFEAAINSNTLMASFIWANNEIGTIQDIKSISAICEKHQIALHLDAVQAFGQISVDLSLYPIDMLTLSAHKFYGPKGIGCLYIKKGLVVDPLIHGGAQEIGKRSGTENISGIVGMAKAVEIAYQKQQVTYELFSYLSSRLYQRIITGFDCVVNGPDLGGRRLPNNLSISFRDVLGTQLAYWLDQNDIYLSTGSACDSTSIEPSHVLKAIKVPNDYIKGTIRISIGRDFIESDIPRIIARLKDGIDAIS